MKKPTRKQIEKAAAAVIKIVTPHGSEGWNPAWISKAKWPKDFYVSERAFARKIAKAALEAAWSP